MGIIVVVDAVVYRYGYVCVCVVFTMYINENGLTKNSLYTLSGREPRHQLLLQPARYLSTRGNLVGMLSHVR